MYLFAHTTHLNVSVSNSTGLRLEVMVVMDPDETWWIGGKF